MIKVFLVEDEVIIRNGIKKNIHWEQDGFQFVGEAGDGELAYPLIRKTKPDILITDIRMPFMNGLQLSTLVKKEFPQMKIIILSGYNDFDYAKQAIHIGVTDYLLKPVTPKVLLETVKKVAAVIQNDREKEQMLQQYQQQIQRNDDQKRLQLLQDVLAGRIDFCAAVERGASLGMDLAASCYQMLLFKMMPQTQQQSEEAVACQQTLSDTWEKEPRLLQFTRGVDGWALLLMGDSTEALCTLVASVRQNIEQIMRSSGNLAWFGGLGRPVNRLNQLMKSYQEANKAFACRFLTDSRKILSSDEIGSLFGKSKKMDLHAIQTGETNRHAIDRFLRSGTLQEVEGFVEQYFCSIGEVNYQSLLFQNYIVMDCYLAVCDFLGALGLSNDSLSEQVRDVNLVLQGPMQIEQIKLYIKTLFSETMTLRNEKSERKYSRLMENAKTYLDENYENNDLSLNVVAAQVNVSPSYFSSIFRQKTGVTFVEYLTRLRMEKAKELLLCSDCSSTEIGYTVGYKDPHYFSSLFKKMYGCTPKEYRMHRGEAK